MNGFKPNAGGQAPQPFDERLRRMRRAHDDKVQRAIRAMTVSHTLLPEVPAPFFGRQRVYPFAWLSTQQGQRRIRRKTRAREDLQGRGRRIISG